MNESLGDSNIFYIGMALAAALAGIVAFKFPQYNSFGEVVRGESTKAMAKLLSQEHSDEDISKLYNKIVAHDPKMKQLLRSKRENESIIRKNLLDLGIDGSELKYINRTIMQLKTHAKKVG